MILIVSIAFMGRYIIENNTDVYDRFISTLNDAGFLTEGEVTFPHKQSAFVKLRRENFEAPAL
jgi:hypothetical protein